MEYNIANETLQTSELSICGHSEKRIPFRTLRRCFTADKVCEWRAPFSTHNLQLHATKRCRLMA